MASIRTTNVGDTLTIKKECGISSMAAYSFLKPSHPLSAYGVETNPNDILQAGTKLAVIYKGKPNTKYRQSYVTVNLQGRNFDIFASYIKRFCQ